MQHTSATSARILQDRARGEDVARERDLVGEDEIHVVRDRRDERRPRVAAGDVDQHGTHQRVRAHGIHRLACRAPFATAQFTERASLLLVQHDRAKAALAQAARVEHPARPVDEADDAHRGATVARQRRDLIDQLATDAADAEQDDIRALRATADLPTADLVQVEGCVHGTQCGGRLTAVDDE